MFASALSQQSQHSVQRRSIRKASSIGGTKILECEIDYPTGTWIEHIITWRKQGIEVPIFIQFNGYPPHLDPSYQGRLRLVEQASVEVSDIRISDEGWYECTIVFLQGDQEQNSNGTWVYLSVNCEYQSFISFFLLFFSSLCSDVGPLDYYSNVLRLR